MTDHHFSMFRPFMWMAIRIRVCQRLVTLRRQCQECATERQLRLTDSMSSLLDLVNRSRLCVNFN
jgi:hypothetical protein